MKKTRSFFGLHLASVLLLLSLQAVAVASAPAKALDPSDNEASREIGKLQSFEIGARTGSFERWDLEGLSRFDGVSMTVNIDKTDKEGKGNRKQWASGFRVILDEKPQDESTVDSRYIVAFIINRQTRILNTTLIAEGQNRDLGVDLDASQPLAISVLRVDDEFIRLKINERSFKIRCALKIQHIAVSSSGMFISTKNFVLLPPEVQ